MNSCFNQNFKHNLTSFFMFSFSLFTFLWQLSKAITPQVILLRNIQARLSKNVSYRFIKTISQMHRNSYLWKICMNLKLNTTTAIHVEKEFIKKETMATESFIFNCNSYLYLHHKLSTLKPQPFQCCLIAIVILQE